MSSPEPLATAHQPVQVGRNWVESTTDPQARAKLAMASQASHGHSNSRRRQGLGVEGRHLPDLCATQ